MDRENVNRKCSTNRPDIERIEFSYQAVDKVYSAEAPPLDLNGSERHFFAKPFGE
jgi:hypothetical protein